MWTFRWAAERFVPSSLDMKDDTRVKVTLNGQELQGAFRGAAPDGSYAVKLDDGRLMAFESVKLV